MGEPSTPASGGGWTPPSIEHLQTLLPQYEISRLLGHGGMGAVYEGVQSNLDRKVAIKILPETLSADEEGLNFKERFKLEAKSMANMDHPGIISVYDFGETSEGQLYFVMEFIDGMDIHQYLKHEGGRLPPEHAIAIVAHVLDALGYAHKRGIVHRDIKPANIMIKSDGRVKVADFGLVKRLSETGEGSPDSTLTQTNITIGTPDFVAPESLEIGQDVDHRADLYAIGVMFYQMLTGSVPRGNFKPPSGRVEGLDPRLDPIVSRAMEADPDDRFPSAIEFREAVDEILSSPVPEEQHTGPVTPRDGKSSGLVTPGGKRLHLTSVQKKTPAPQGATGPVKGKPPTGPVAEGKKKNPVLIAAIAVLGLAAIGGAAFFLNGGDGNGKKKSKVAKVSEGGADAKRSPKPMQKKSAGPTLRKVQPKAKPPFTTAATPQRKPKEKPAPDRPDPAKVAEKPKPKPANPAKAPKKVKPAEIEPTPGPGTTPTVPATAPVVAATSPGVPEQPDATTVPMVNDPVARELAEIDRKYRDVFETPFQEAIGTLNTQFTEALKREEQSASQTGDLDLVLAFQNEAKRIGSGEGAGSAEAADAPPKLKELRSTWHTQVEALDATRGENRKKADVMRDQALDALQQDLVKAQNIEAAQKVKALREGFPEINAAGSPGAAAASGESEWITLFNGDSLDGWKVNGDAEAFSVVGGAIRGRGKRALLYYEGPETDPQAGVFRNFEFRAMVKTEEAFNSGVYFHMVMRSGEPVGGYEAQIANENRDPRKTGSLWEVSDVPGIKVSDGDWFLYGIRVEGKEITISIDDEAVMRWTEPDDWVPKKKDQRLGEGFFALQSNPGGQDKLGEVWFKEIQVRRLAE